MVLLETTERDEEKKTYIAVLYLFRSSAKELRKEQKLWVVLSKV
jgi:hypothetical protein